MSDVFERLAELRVVPNGRVEGKTYASTDPRSGKSRIEAESVSTSGAHTFLFVLSTAPQAPSVRLERDGGLLGAEVDGAKILFRTDGAAGGKIDGRALPTRVTAK